MTVFVCSLFLPKTIHFTLPGTPPLGADPTRASLSGSSNPKPTKAATLPPKPKPAAPTGGRPAPLARQPSLFQKEDITPPHTPTEETDSNLFANEDGFRIQFPHGASSSIEHAKTWGSRANQPKSRASSPPPSASLSENNRTMQKARELGRQGVLQPRSLVRSDSHDRVFASAGWMVVNADQGNGTQQKEDIEAVLANEHNMLTVFCSDKDFDAHPVACLPLPDPHNPKSKAYEDHSWKYYVNVNQAFADQIVKNWKRGDVIWIHDYHLLLVPGMVRKKLPEAKIGFFLHVAFPSSEVFRCLAVRKELLEGMLGANLVGFQIHEYGRHFLQTCSRILSAEATPDGLQLEDRFVDVIHLTIGIDPVSLREHLDAPDVAKWLQVLQERYKGKKLIVARDKLDHVRGVRQKLLSYELFLNKNPQWRENAVLIQVALSSNEKSDLEATVSDIVTRVNSSWANLAYQPVVYLKQDIDYAQYLALLTIADALMITSQREGMNLTSHEYLFCQDGKLLPEKKHGSLILSEFTGTSSLFAKNELAVNPWDYRQCADAIKQALEMGEEEKDRRWENLYKRVNGHTGSHWFTEFLGRLDIVYEEQHKRDQTSVPRLSIPALSNKYLKAERRLFIIDYEGTLVAWGPVNQIIPISPQRTLDVLNDLLLDERNTVYVMSGRRPEELDRVFRRVPNLGLIAENGCFLKVHGSDSWTEMADLEHVKDWKESVRPIMTYYLERTPGAEIEERRCSLIFHYKSAEDYESASRQASDCASHVNDACESQRVHAIALDGCIAVEPIDWTKRTAARQVFETLKTEMSSTQEHKTPVDFLMVIGDGREDEKVFKWANRLQDDGSVQNVVTVSLGNRNTEATATLTQGVSGVLSCLQRLASLDS
ncbi:HAD-superfamily hydrolase, subfamily IIB [Fusarium oxysporum f. sp. vasinfectum]|nr:HAD-superfamily hydrolase, subfamily IIB [Fusarium oxysporum f. sp. vasinfectum]